MKGLEDFAIAPIVYQDYLRFLVLVNTYPFFTLTLLAAHYLVQCYRSRKDQQLRLMMSEIMNEEKLQ